MINTVPTRTMIFRVGVPYIHIYTYTGIHIRGQHCKDYKSILTHYEGRMTHKYASVQHAYIASDNGLSHIVNYTPKTYFSEIWFTIQNFSFMKMHLEVSSAKSRPFVLDLNVLTPVGLN